MGTLKLNSHAAGQPPPASGAVGTCIAEINEAVHSCKGWAIEAGKLLLEAKEKLAHGQWTSMFQSGQLHISLRVAEMLMKIAGHPTLADPKYFSFLPPAWSVLHELSKLPPQSLEEKIQAKTVHPELTLEEARHMVNQVLAKGACGKSKPSAKAFNLQRQQTRLTNYLDELATRWPMERHGLLADLLEETARKLRTGGNP